MGWRLRSSPTPGLPLTFLCPHVLPWQWLRRTCWCDSLNRVSSLCRCQLACAVRSFCSQASRPSASNPASAASTAPDNRRISFKWRADGGCAAVPGLTTVVCLLAAWLPAAGRFGFHAAGQLALWVAIATETGPVPWLRLASRLRCKAWPTAARSAPGASLS